MSKHQFEIGQKIHCSVRPIGTYITLESGGFVVFEASAILKREASRFRRAGINVFGTHLAFNVDSPSRLPRENVLLAVEIGPKVLSDRFLLSPLRLTQLGYETHSASTFSEVSEYPEFISTGLRQGVATRVGDMLGGLASLVRPGRKPGLRSQGCES